MSIDDRSRHERTVVASQVAGFVAMVGLLLAALGWG